MSDDVVVPFTGITTVDHTPEHTLGAAAKAGLTTVVVIGFENDGDLWFSGSQSDAYQTLWLLELARKRLMEIAEK